MNTENKEQDNEVLDRIIRSRRTCRKFLPEIPPDAMIENIIQAGLHAPFAAAAIGHSDEYFRRFFVLRKDSRAMARIIPLAFNAAIAAAKALEHASEKNEQLRGQAAGFMARLEMIKKTGMVPGIGTAPFTIVVAEKKGFPPVEQQSLAHCLENMWLKSTTLGLGFQLISIVSNMADNPEFCQVLGIQPGKWGLMGCAIGYPAEPLPPSTRPSAGEVTTWLE
jgi:nitroreductase